MRRVTTCALVAATLSLAACGTTVPRTQGTAGASSALGDGTGTSASLDAGVGTGTAPTGGTGTLANDALPGETAAVGNTTEASTELPVVSAGTTATGSPIVSGRGVTTKTLTIGAAFATGTEGAASTFGITGAGAISEQDVWDAVIRDVNKTGGVLGRKLVLYSHPVDLATFVANPAQTYAQICSDFRDDHKVFAAFITISDPALRQCLGKMGTPFVVYGANVGSIMPAAAFSEFGGSYLYVPGGTTDEKLAELFIRSLVARSFTAKWDTANGRPGIAPVKLGLIHADTPDQNHLYASYAKELRKHGLAFADTVTYAGDASTALASTQGAVLKFASEGITHVFGASAFFLRYAESQHYRPRYAFLPGLGAFGAANSPAEQMAGAMTIGWSPTEDVNASEDPGPTAGMPRCNAAMRAAGLVSNNRQDIKLMYGICDGVYSFRDALTAGRSPSVVGLRRGFESLGTRFGPALTFNTSLGPNRHYGVSSMRDLAYDSACKCLEYTSRSNRS